MAKRIVIDTDPGTDDALAILLALNSPELDVRALTVVHGNTTLAQGTENALRLAALAGRPDLPVVPGADRPLEQPLRTAELIHGENGMAEIELPQSSSLPDPREAADAVWEFASEDPGALTLVALGPLTNLAVALQRYPELPSSVESVVLMGGSLSGGNATGAAEANIYCDLEAARLVFDAGWPITMVGLDVTHRTLFRRTHLEQLSQTRGPCNDLAVELFERLYVRWAALGWGEAFPMHDPLAVGVAIDPSLVSTEAVRLDVELAGDHSRGATVASRWISRYEEREDRSALVELLPAQPNARVATDVEAERFLQEFIRRLAGR